jgi:hypothetical protein
MNRLPVCTTYLGLQVSCVTYQVEYLKLVHTMFHALDMWCHELSVAFVCIALWRGPYVGEAGSRVIDCAGRYYVSTVESCQTHAHAMIR